MIITSAKDKDSDNEGGGSLVQQRPYARIGSLQSDSHHPIRQGTIKSQGQMSQSQAQIPNEEEYEESLETERLNEEEYDKISINVDQRVFAFEFKKKVRN